MHESARDVSGAIGVFPPHSSPPARFVPIFEGSTDGKTWRRYKYKYMTSATTSCPRHIAPFHPRWDHAGEIIRSAACIAGQLLHGCFDYRPLCDVMTYVVMCDAAAVITCHLLDCCHCTITRRSHPSDFIHLAHQCFTRLLVSTRTTSLPPSTLPIPTDSRDQLRYTGSHRDCSSHQTVCGRWR